MNKLKKIVLLFTLALLVTGCNNDYSPKDYTKKYDLPQELADCTIHEIDGQGVLEMAVVRCPNSDTTTQWSESCGKNCTRTRTTVVLDGVEYEKKVKE